jgi:hypothetical protein
LDFEIKPFLFHFYDGVVEQVFNSGRSIFILTALTTV